MTILDKIIAEKRNEVAKLVNQTFVQIDVPKPTKTFKQLINEQNKMGIIAEIKRASPSKGMINEGVDPIKQAKIYAENGASAISVLTDYPFFKGSMDDLRAVRAAVDIPILCKDFVIDKIQIDQAHAAGANIILLIAAALDDELLAALYHYAQEKDLEILCEVHNEEEMERVLKLKPDIIGVNNRDLKTFKVDLAHSARLASMVTDPNTILVSESGLKTRKEVETVAQAGAEAVLVGETFMRANDVKAAMKDFQVPLPDKARI